MRVLYIGPTWRGSNAQSFRRAFEILGHDVVAVETEVPLAFYGRSIRLRLVQKLLGRPLRRHTRPIRQATLVATRAVRPEIVFACKALHLDGELLEDLRRVNGAMLVHWHADDYRNPSNTSPEFQSAIPVYDVCVTPKTFNVDELRADGARRVEFLPYAFDPEVHHPVPARKGPPSTACFVGGWEPERASFLEHAAREGIDLEVWGAYWDRLPRGATLRACCRYREVFAEDMARVFASSQLCLGFLRRANRDLHTARTFEIPAAGGAMLTERTEEQRAFFEEGKEALYFETPEEMVATIREYTARPADLARIRAAGLARCQRDRYSYAGRLSALLARLGRG